MRRLYSVSTSVLAICAAGTIAQAALTVTHQEAGDAYLGAQYAQNDAFSQIDASTQRRMVFTRNG